MSEEKEEDDFWSEGSFAQPMSDAEMKKKMRTFHMKNDEEMDYDCRECKAKISAHNRDWHDGMCDGCFYRKYFPRHSMIDI